MTKPLVAVLVDHVDWRHTASAYETLVRTEQSGKEGFLLQLMLNCCFTTDLGSLSLWCMVCNVERQLAPVFDSKLGAELLAL
ncbi:hypothetical protein T4E_7618 [Trichinella pseudospiralis]|uniref:Uncharacterized protein n=1 Tax=Trichinella pseudospiralis TaxID=6337 RepID=A0A0V0XSF4_TRIPS|nr:hypothetical protein T4E_7618 [Trichinella pseudospiralis]